MKKTISKLFVVLLFGVCLFFSCFLYSINVYGYSNYNDSSIVSYDESYLLNQLDDYRNSLNMNTDDFDIYNTSDLIEEIICSQFNYIYYFNSMENGLNIFKKNNLYFKELLTRNDVSDALMSLYSELDLSKNDRMINLKNYRLEVLLEQTEILNLFSSDELSQLDSIKFVREKQKLECESYNYSKNLQEIALLSRENNSAPYTPNGNEVDYATLFSGNDFTPEEIESMTYNDNDKLGFTSNIRLSNPTKKYNCHSYAWYSQNTYNNNYWIDFPNSYIEDNSYDVGLGKKDDIICYFAKYYVYYNGEFHSISDQYIAHSAIISNVGLNFNKTNLDTYSELTVTSKW